MSVRRVLMTGDTAGGVWTFVLELAEALCRRGAEVVLVAFGGHPTDAQFSQAGSIPNLSVIGSDFRLEWMENPWEDVEASGRWLMRLQDEYRPEVIHLNSFGHGALAWRAPVVLTAHSCALSRHRAVKGAAASSRWQRYEVLVGNSLRAADAVTAPSRAMAAELALHYGFAADRCRVIANGRSAARFTRGEKEPFVFTAGRLWDEAKNIRALAEVAPDLSWPVYIAGETGHISFPGCKPLGRLAAPEIASWYSRASIYAMPARYEPFGLSILEAALSGCALVLGDIPSLREIWGEAALFAAPGNTSALEKQIRTLIDDRQRREEMARRAYARGVEFGPDAMAEAYLDAYGSARKARSAACGS